jgi:hypothetical protein
MTITKQSVANKITAYLHHQMTQARLEDWAENALMDGEFTGDSTPLFFIRVHPYPSAVNKSFYRG